jgi:hypothetical protein
MKKKILLLCFSLTLTTCFATDFGKFVSDELPTYEDFSQYIQVKSIIQDISNNITYIYVDNTYIQDIFVEQMIINNITIPYEILNVSQYYNGNITSITNYTYLNNTFEINNVLIRTGTNVFVIQGNNSNINITTTDNLFVLPQSMNFTANLTEKYNFTFTIDSYSTENYTVNISVYQDGKKIFNLTNYNVTNYSYQFTVENISFNTTGTHTIEINVTSNISEYTYTDNYRIYYIEIENQTNLPPQITVYSPENKTYNTNNILINFSIYDTDLFYGGWTLYLNNTTQIYQNTTFENINFSKYFNLPNGNYNLKVSAIDKENNINVTEVNFVVYKRTKIIQINHQQSM